jgi:hypothetical protein
MKMVRALAALLLAASARAATLAADVVPTLSAVGFSAAPAPIPAAWTAPSLSAPSFSVGLSAAFSPVSLAAPAAFSPAALAPAFAAAAPAEPAPLPAAASAASNDGRSARIPAPARASAASAAGVETVDAGRALFDRAADARPLSEIVAANSARPLRGVFIQHEHEGSLLAPDSRDSSGSIFTYYRPVELRPALVAQVEKGLGGFDKAVYAVRRFFQFGRGGVEGAWRAWPVSAKLAYLDALERAVTVERGPPAAWDGKVSLLLEKTGAAPDFATRNPHMEAPPRARRGDVGARFLQPEIVSDKTRPAASVAQALERTRMVIAETGHAGTQYHVFIKADPKLLLAQLDRLDGALQLINDSLFAKAAESSEQNIAHGSLQPWHRGRSERVRRLLEAADPAPHAPSADDPDSEKHAFVGLRGWGMEDGKAVVSLELRGASLPWKSPRNSMVKGVEGSVERPERDYSEAQAYLTYLALYAEAVARGAAPAVPASSRVLDESAADAVLGARAKALGVPDGAFDGLAAFARRLNGARSVPPGYLFPFAASSAESPSLRALADEIIVLGARLKAAEDAGREDNIVHARYAFWQAYASWASRFGAAQDARLAELVRASSR